MSLRSISIADMLSDPDQLQNFAEGYNSRIDKVPGILKSMLGSERVNIKIFLSDGNIFRLGYETKNARITRIADGGINNPTIVVVSSQNTIEKINGSKDPLSTFRREREAGNLSIDGQTLATKTKLRAALSSDHVLWFFYNILFG